jgi:hypothetical protein
MDLGTFDFWECCWNKLYLDKEVWMEVVNGGVVGMESESLRDTVNIGKFNIMVFWRQKRVEEHSVTLQAGRSFCD